MSNKATLDVFGDTLDVEWTGSVWVSPSNGQQHPRVEDAMRHELEQYYMACGDDIDDPEIAQQIDNLLANIDLHDDDDDEVDRG